MPNETWIIKCEKCKHWFWTELPTKHTSDTLIHHGFNEEGFAKEMGVSAAFGRVVAEFPREPRCNREECETGRKPKERR